MARDWKVRAQIQVCLQGREKALAARESAMPGYIHSTARH